MLIVVVVLVIEVIERVIGTVVVEMVVVPDIARAIGGKVFQLLLLLLCRGLSISPSPPSRLIIVVVSYIE